MTDYSIRTLLYPKLNLVAWVWDALVYPLMRPRVIEVFNIFADCSMEMAIVQDQHVIQALASHTANEPLTNRIGFRRSHWRPQHLYPPVFCHTIEALPVLAIVVSYQETRAFFIGRGRSYLLRYPEITRQPRHPILHNPT
jgi:hypothetical protein